MHEGGDFFNDPNQDWRSRLATTVDVMRELSRVNDPQEMNQVYTRRMVELFPTTRQISLSRRKLHAPSVRVTRSSHWTEEINPWKEPHRLPVLNGGLFADLLYADEPRIIDDLKLAPNDPAAEYLRGQRSLIAIPLYDAGSAMNMVVATRAEAHAFPPERFPDLVWMSNLFGRATQSSLLSKRLQTASEQANHEIQIVARMQRSLLPEKLPDIPTVDMAVHYQTSSKAGGDYYDVLQLPKGRWGFLMADVSGHGVPAAVLMAITHSLTKTYTGNPWPPGLLLSYLNKHLAAHYTRSFGTFVTACYAIYDPDHGTLTYANAGHPPPRLIRCSDGTRQVLEGRQRLPLGILEQEVYPEDTVSLVPNDQVIFYTDGITEAVDGQNERYGTDRLDQVLSSCPTEAGAMVRAVLADIERFTQGTPANDDRTLLVAKFVTSGSKF
jgi:sigma-B regulation protein RsbU (phosphoserine phosphatase)